MRRGGDRFERERAARAPWVTRRSAGRSRAVSAGWDRRLGKRSITGELTRSTRALARPAAPRAGQSRRATALRPALRARLTRPRRRSRVAAPRTAAARSVFGMFAQHGRIAKRSAVERSRSPPRARLRREASKNAPVTPSTIVSLARRPRAARSSVSRQLRRASSRHEPGSLLSPGRIAARAFPTSASHAPHRRDSRETSSACRAPARAM